MYSPIPSLELATHHQKTTDTVKIPGVVGDIHSREREPGRMADGLKTAAKQMLTLSTN